MYYSKDIPFGLINQEAKPVRNNSPRPCTQAQRHWLEAASLWAMPGSLTLLQRARAFYVFHPLILYQRDSSQHPSPSRMGRAGTHTPAATAAALHVPVVDGGSDISVAEAPSFQKVLITTVEGDIAPWRHLLCEQNGVHKPTRTQKGRKLPPSKRDHLLRGTSA